VGSHCAGRARPPKLDAVQLRTWNLSAIWRLEGPSGGDGGHGAGGAGGGDGGHGAGGAGGGRGGRGGAGPAWLKQVPRFLAHEAAVLRWIGMARPSAAPTLLGAGDTGRMLLDHVGGADRYGAPAADRDSMVGELHELQVHATGALDRLAALGVPDRRGDKLAAHLSGVAERHGARIAGLDQLMDGLDDRLAAVRDCGLPDTLVHGDFHPGNVRSDGSGPPCVLDWGDSTLGNPAFDIIRMTGDLDRPTAEPLLQAWGRRWRASAPGCAPERAITLLRPVAALLDAATYAAFVANIEPAERPHHARDVTEALYRAVRRATAAR
jgi:phosphotransferase family enzyme